MPLLEFDPEYLNELLSIISRELPGYEVWAFGSRVKQQAHSGSDLDLVVRNPHQLDKPCHQLVVFKQSLKDSHIPILIDVVDWARIPDSFRDEIQQQYEVLS